MFPEEGSAWFQVFCQGSWITNIQTAPPPPNLQKGKQFASPKISKISMQMSAITRYVLFVCFQGPSPGVFTIPCFPTRNAKEFESRLEVTSRFTWFIRDLTFPSPPQAFGSCQQRLHNNSVTSRFCTAILRVFLDLNSFFQPKIWTP